jgi:hypothetical protein
VDRLTRQSVVLAAIVMVLLTITGCDNSFDPRGPYEKKLVVYSVLSNRSDSQYVRIYSTYNPTGYDPLENTSDTQVRNAKVTITDDSATYTLKQTIIPRDDRSRYGSDIVAYSAYPCRLRPGKQYSLAITSDQGNVTSAVSVPGRASVYNNTPYIFANPRKSVEDIPVSVTLSSNAQAYLVRLYLNFDLGSGPNVEHRRLEIPSGIDSVGGSFMYTYVFAYPSLTRRPSNAYSSLNLVYPYAAYFAVYRNLEGQYAIWFKPTSVTFILTQVDMNLYNYYNIANGFRDPYSIREDQPDYSNIVGGFGVYGAMVEDSLVVDLQSH